MSIKWFPLYWVSKNNYQLSLKLLSGPKSRLHSQKHLLFLFFGNSNRTEIFSKELLCATYKRDNSFGISCAKWPAMNRIRGYLLLIRLLTPQTIFSAFLLRVKKSLVTVIVEAKVAIYSKINQICSGLSCSTIYLKKCKFIRPKLIKLA